jgi:uncharacterized membrane protein
MKMLLAGFLFGGIAGTHTVWWVRIRSALTPYLTVIAGIELPEPVRKSARDDGFRRARHLECARYFRG